MRALLRLSGRFGPVPCRPPGEFGRETDGQTDKHTYTHADTHKTETDRQTDMQKVKRTRKHTNNRDTKDTMTQRDIQTTELISFFFPHICLYNVSITVHFCLWDEAYLI
jgi:hypothetical protein